jgi:hypothetical protein
MTTRDDVTEFGFFGSDRHDTEPCPHPEGCEVEANVLPLHVMSAITARVRAEGGTALDAWQALRAARKLMVQR